MNSSTEEKIGDKISHQKINERNRAEMRRLLRFFRKLQKHGKSLAYVQITHNDPPTCCYGDIGSKRWNQVLEEVSREFAESGKINIDVRAE